MKSIFFILALLVLSLNGCAQENYQEQEEERIEDALTPRPLTPGGVDPHDPYQGVRP